MSALGDKTQPGAGAVPAATSSAPGPGAHTVDRYLFCLLGFLTMLLLWKEGISYWRVGLGYALVGVGA